MHRHASTVTQFFSPPSDELVSAESGSTAGTGSSKQRQLDRPAARGERSQQAGDPGQSLVLVVDDDPDFLRLARRFLEPAGFRVAVGTDGNEAVALFDQVRPDVVLMDLNLPGQDGFQACKAIRALPGGRETPVVIVTGLNEPTTVQGTFDAGATDFVAKPLNWLLLSKRLQYLSEAGRLYRHRRSPRHGLDTDCDSLTGLPSRRLFGEILKHAAIKSQRQGMLVAVVFVNIDRFREVNEARGADCGDALLRQASQRLKRCLRGSDYFARHQGSSAVARRGGDEFLILLTDISNVQGAARAAERILDALAQPFSVDGGEIFLTASAGIAVHPPAGGDPDALVDHAETAMYHAKKQGRGSYEFYAESMNAEVSRRLSLENLLRRALQRDELRVFYQPVLNNESSKVVGMEALLRWNQPELGMVSPAEFIPVAEDAGLMPAIGEWVLRAACRSARKWVEEGLRPIRVAVNVSYRQLQQGDFPGLVARVLAENDLEPKLLELELTERGVMPNDPATLHAFHRLAALGVGLAVDDFGTGNSAFSYLRHFPLQTLKIDRSFISGITGEGNDADIVAGVIAMAHRLKLKVIAEGVETEEQRSFLRRSRCDEFQGFIFAPPMPLEDLRQLFEEQESAA